MSVEFFQQLSQKYPFITVCTYAGNEYIGIIQNRDNTVTTLYDYGSIVDVEIKKLFLELASQWWWESNRSIPINIFLKEEWIIFKPYIKTFINKDLDILLGPCTSLLDIAKRKSKKKSITLVRKID